MKLKKSIKGIFTELIGINNFIFFIRIIRFRDFTLHCLSITIRKRHSSLSIPPKNDLRDTSFKVDDKFD